MTRAAAVLACALLAAAPADAAPAEAPALRSQQAPADAAALVAWHLELDGPPQDAEDAAWRAYVYVRAGAEGEARAAAARLEQLAGDDEQAGLFRLEADTWSPHGRAVGVDRAADWLERHEATADPQRAARVRVLRDFLRDDQERAARVRRADAATGWLPLLALAVFGAWIAAVARLLRR